MNFLSGEFGPHVIVDLIVVHRLDIPRVTASASISSAQLTASFGFASVTAGAGFIGYYQNVTTAADTIYVITSDGNSWSYMGPFTAL